MKCQRYFIFLFVVIFLCLFAPNALSEITPNDGYDTFVDNTTFGEFLSPPDTPTPVPYLPCDTELVTNGDLEVWTAGPGGPPDSWSHGTGLTLVQTSDEVYTGTYAGLVTKTGTGTQTFEQIIEYEIIPESEYHFSYWVIDDNGASGNRSRAWIYWASEPGGQGFISNSFTGYSDDESGWQELTVTATAPVNAVSARVRIAFYGDTGVEYYVDTISLVELCESTPTPLPTSTVTPTPTVTPTFTPVPTNTPTASPPSPTITPTISPDPTHTPTGTQPPTNTPTAEPTEPPTETPEPTLTPTAEPTVTPTEIPSLPCESELVWNGEFNDWSAGPGEPPDFWTPGSGLVLEQTTESVYSGDYACLVTKTGAGTVYFEQIVAYQINPGSEYRLSYQIIDNDGIPENRSRAWIYWASEPGGQGFISNSYTAYSTDETEWQEVYGIAIAPDNAVSARIRIAFYGDTDVEYFVDSASLFELCEPTPTPEPTETPHPTPTPTTGPGTPTATPQPTQPPEPTATPTLPPEPTPTPTAEPTDAVVVINEVFYNPEGVNTGKQFIELMNVSDEPLDLTGYDLKPDTSTYYTFGEFLLAPGGRVTVRINTDGEDTEDELFTGSTSNMRSNNGYVALFNSTTHSHTTIVDYVAYGADGQTWESAAVTAGIWTAGDFVPLCDEDYSMNLFPDGVDNNSSEDWICCEPSINLPNCETPPTQTPTPTFPPGTPTHTPSPTMTPEPTPTPEPRTGVVINEVLFDPEGIDTGKEFIELFNNSPDVIELTEYDLKPDTSSYYTFPEFFLQPYSFVTIRINTSGTDTDDELFTGPTSNMGNTTGSVALFNSTTHSVNTIVDYTAYGAGGQTWESTAVNAGIWTEGDYIPVPDAEGYSINLCPDGHDFDSSINWQPDDPSPGAPNNCSEPTPTPTPTHTPTPTRTPTGTPTPRPDSVPVIGMAGFGNTDYRLSTGGTLQILAWVTDPDENIENVYVKLGGEIILELFDDGQSGDFGAGNGIYGLYMELPPVSLPEDESMGLNRLQLQIVAYDSDGLSSYVWPFFTVEHGHRHEYEWTSAPGWWDTIQSDDSYENQAVPPSERPRIFMAGFMDTRIRSSSGGQFTMLAFTTSDLPIATVELYYHGLPTGVMLYDDGLNGDFASGNDVFGLSFYVEPGALAPGNYPFQLRATDVSGTQSDLWPYLTVNE
jgi:hypothetical protein